jgi:2'-phosphotransferase
LRHGAIKEKLNIGPDGFVLVKDLLKHNKFKGINLNQIEAIVKNNDKKRFELKE